MEGKKKLFLYVSSSSFHLVYNFKMYKFLINFNYILFKKIYNEIKHEKTIFLYIFFLFPCYFPEPNITGRNKVWTKHNLKEQSMYNGYFCCVKQHTSSNNIIFLYFLRRGLPVHAVSKLNPISFHSHSSFAKPNPNPNPKIVIGSLGVKNLNGSDQPVPINLT